MEFIRCSRCGAFYTNGGYVCAKCTPKDNLELSTFKNYLDGNTVNLSSLSQIAMDTGISEKNLNRFLNYKGMENYRKIQGGL